MTKKEFAKIAMALKTYYPKESLLPNEQAMELWFFNCRTFRMTLQSSF